MRYTKLHFIWTLLKSCFLLKYLILLKFPPFNYGNFNKVPGLHRSSCYDHIVRYHRWVHCRISHGCSHRFVLQYYRVLFELWRNMEVEELVCVSSDSTSENNYHSLARLLIEPLFRDRLGKQTKSRLNAKHARTSVQTNQRIVGELKYFVMDFELQPPLSGCSRDRCHRPLHPLLQMLIVSNKFREEYQMMATYGPTNILNWIVRSVAPPPASNSFMFPKTHTQPFFA